ncbi:g2/mitotic-specific cyclin cdc13 [Mycena filopes]|nr:g2/mitotic-specific cyclin cdc13 [Mycena filopes]
MSTNLPPRRVAGRTTRTTALKDNENANARPSRINTRAKPLSANAAAAAANVTGGSTRATAPTAASRAKNGLGNATDTKADVPAGKRKREALGEVTALANNRTKTQTAKGKEKDGAVKKEKTDRTVAKTRHDVVVDEPLVDVTNDAQVDADAMLIDLPPHPALSVAPVRKSRVSGENTSRHSGPPPRRGRSSILVPKQELETRPTTEEEEEDPAMLEEARLVAAEEAVNARIAAELAAYADEEPEADPETSPWDDLDADDADDPVMVSEYVVDIFNYLKQIELTTMPNPELHGQPNRARLEDASYTVRCRLLAETLFLCVNIIDRFLSARVVSLAKLQLVGVTCMFIASKFEEVVAPSVSQFVEIAEGTYTEAEILQAERYVLKTLDWNLSYPNPVHYLRRVSKADDYNVKARTLGKYLLEIGCLEWRLIAAPPSLLAAAAIWLARIALGEGELGMSSSSFSAKVSRPNTTSQSPNLAHYSSYPESALLPTANLMLNYILKPIRHQAFHDKYSGKKFAKASIFMRQWALERWEENALVDLGQELAQLKNEIRVERVHEEVRIEQEQQAARAGGGGAGREDGEGDGGAGVEAAED